MCNLFYFSGGSREIEKYADIEKFRVECGASSVMVGRTAQGNCSIFCSKGLKPLDNVIKDYLKYAVDFDNSPSNTKYCVQNMLKELQETPRGKRFLDCQTLEQIWLVCISSRLKSSKSLCTFSTIFGMGEYCRKKQLEYQDKGIMGRREVAPDMFNPDPKKQKIGFDEDVITMKFAFIRASYVEDPCLPKSRLNIYCCKNRLKLPTYHIIQEDKLFRAVMVLNGQKYSSSYW